MNTGGPHRLLRRQLITPDPDSPATMNPAFLSEGMTTTHSALLQIESGIPLSGELLSSETTAAASFSFFASDLDTAATAVVVSSNTSIGAATVLMIRMSTSVTVEYCKFERTASTTFSSGRTPRTRDGVKRR